MEVVYVEFVKVEVVGEELDDVDIVQGKHGWITRNFKTVCVLKRER